MPYGVEIVAHQPRIGPDQLVSLEKPWETACTLHTTIFEDEVQSRNMYKRIAGGYGRVHHSDNGSGVDGAQLLLVRNRTGEVVQTGTTGEQGFFTLVYKHTGPKEVDIVSLANSSLQQGTAPGKRLGRAQLRAVHPVEESHLRLPGAAGWEQKGEEVDAGRGRARQRVLGQ